MNDSHQSPMVGLRLRRERRFEKNSWLQHVSSSLLCNVQLPTEYIPLRHSPYPATGDDNALHTFGRFPCLACEYIFHFLSSAPFPFDLSPPRYCLPLPTMPLGGALITILYMSCVPSGQTSLKIKTGASSSPTIRQTGRWSCASHPRGTAVSWEETSSVA